MKSVFSFIKNISNYKKQYKRTPFQKKDGKLILEIKYGGLGDHLFYSHIPKIVKEEGFFKKVYISNFSEYRNNEYKKYIWEINPYIDGFCDEHGFITDRTEVKKDNNLLDALMLAQGIDDGKRFHEPEVYFKPTINSDLSLKRVYDPNYISNDGNIDPNVFNLFLKSNNIDFDLQMKILNKSIIIDKNIETLSVNSLLEYASVILSCKEFFCLVSGGATLAAALRKKATVFYGNGVKQIFLHSKQHIYYKI